MSPRSTRRCCRALWAWAPLLALLTTPVMAAEGETPQTRAGRVPPELIGAYCPPPESGPWHHAAFATALGAVVLLGRRRS